MRFKVGDKVRCVEPGSPDNKLTLGAEYVVMKVGGDMIQVHAKVSVYASRFELAESANDITELEQLVATANAGLTALHAIQDKEEFCKRLESRWKDLKWSAFSKIAETVELRIKPKAPAFEPFTLGELGGPYRYKVEMRGTDRIAIGCQEFDVKILVRSLQGVLLEKVTGPVPSGDADKSQLLVCRDGLKHKNGTLSWADADQLLEALNKLKETK